MYKILNRLQVTSTLSSLGYITGTEAAAAGELVGLGKLPVVKHSFLSAGTLGRPH